MANRLRTVDQGTEAQPLIVPFAFRQLDNCSSVTVERQFSCCWSVYSVTCAHTGTLFILEGCYSYGLKDNNAKKLAEVRRPWMPFWPRYLQVLLSGCAPICVRAAPRTPVILIQDGGQTVLRIRIPLTILPNSEFEIMSNTTNTRIGVVRKQWSDYEVCFPEDVAVRYKAALIASCIYIDSLPTKRRAPNGAGAGTDDENQGSSTYVNFQDSLLNSTIVTSVLRRSL